MKQIALAIIIFIMLPRTCYQKKYFEHCIIINNKLNNEIYCIPSYQYPDTTIDFIKSDVIIANKTYLWVGADTTRIVGPEPLKDMKAWKYYVPSDTLLYFILKADDVENQQWEYTKTHYYKMLKFTYKDLEKINFTITIE